MRILITGGAGFIGHHLVRRLSQNPDHHIIVLDNLSRGRTDWPAWRFLNGRLHVQIGDIRNREALQQAAHGAEIIFHLAAQASVMGAQRHAETAFTTTGLGTYRVLEAARAGGARRLIFSSSREVYGEAHYLPVDEGHPLGCKNVYGASKVAGEALCHTFGTREGLEVSVLRLANVFGPGDSGRVIPNFLRCASQKQPVIVFGGEQIVDFVEIGLVVEAMIRASQCAVLPGPVNVGSGQGTTLLDLAQRLQQTVSHPVQVCRQPARPSEVVRFIADIQRMRQHLGIQPPDDPLESLPYCLRDE